MHADFAANTKLDINFAPGLEYGKRFARHLVDAVDRADLQTRFTAGAIVRVNDRGPHRRLVRQGRIIDLSKQAFLNIASLDKGLIDIQLEFLKF